MLLRLREWWLRDHAGRVAGVQLALVAVLTGAVGAGAASRTAGLAAELPPQAASTAMVASADEPAESARLIRLQDLSADAARRWNAANPVSDLPNPPARPFRLRAASVLDETRAVDCMTAAIYYEAGYESRDGQRAVAQVVLNRLRHPAFPKTICGVVFQGSERATGCQFTFTCDGALRRKPTEAGWARAREVARAALGGYVMKKVGNATHYHAEYVAPYWSPRLVKVGAVGAHIFYRWTGGWGLPPAFGGRYAGGESAGLQVATLDGLGEKAELRLAALTVETAAPEAPPIVEAKLAPHAAEAEAELVTAATAAPVDAEALTKPEQLDWLGRPKPAAAPRLAMPTAGTF